MIDHKARLETVVALKSLIQGRVSNFEFEALLPHTDDRAVHEVFHYLWHYYSDGYKNYVKKVRISRSDRQQLSRVILFLYSDLEYEWPRKPNFGTEIGRFFSRWISGKSSHNLKFNMSDNGDMTVWPFIHRKHFIAETSKPRLGLSLRLINQ